MVEDNCVEVLDFVFDMEVMLVEDCEIYGYLVCIWYIWMVIDFCGNFSKISVFVFYEDIYGLEIFGVLVDLCLYCEDFILEFDEVWVKDNYDGFVEVSYNVEYVDMDEGVRIICSWIVSDDCGNVIIEI